MRITISVSPCIKHLCFYLHVLNHPNRNTDASLNMETHTRLTSSFTSDQKMAHYVKSIAAYGILFAWALVPLEVSIKTKMSASFS